MRPEIAQQTPIRMQISKKRSSTKVKLQKLQKKATKENR